MHTWKQTLTSLSLIAVLALSSTSLAFAQADETATASAAEATESAVIDLIKSRLGEVAGALTDILDERTSFTGEVSRVSQEAITVRQFAGTTIVPLTEEVQLLKDDKAASTDDVEVGGWVTVLGTKDDNTVAPEFVIIAEESLQPKDKLVILGTITSISRTELGYTPRSSEAAAEETVALDANTVYENFDGTEVERTEFAEDYSVLIVAQKEQDEDEFTVTTLHALADLNANE